MDAILLKAATVVLIIAVGYVIKRLGWVATQDFPIFSRIVLRITLPCALAVSFDTFDLTPSLLFIAVLAFGFGLAHRSNSTPNSWAAKASTFAMYSLNSATVMSVVDLRLVTISP